ncbi:MAG: GntR family transcriptional regulator [Myxococcales bacterium]
MAGVPERVFQDLCGAVMSGRYGAGEKLPPQRALAAQVGAGMASVREAVRRLEQLGLVEVRHGDAMRVRDWRANAGLEVIAHALLSDDGLLPDLLEARRLMLSQAARLAAERGGGDLLIEIADRLAVTEDPGEALGLDFAFFAELVARAENVVLTLIMNSIRRVYFDHAERFRALVEDPQAIAHLYSAAALAVASGDPQLAQDEVAALAAAQERRLLR